MLNEGLESLDQQYSTILGSRWEFFHVGCRPEVKSAIRTSNHESIKCCINYGLVRHIWKRYYWSFLLWEDSVTGESYKKILRYISFPKLWDHRNDLFFQHHCASPHFVIILHHWSDQRLGSHWICRGSPVAFLPRSPNRTAYVFLRLHQICVYQPLQYYCRGKEKQSVCYRRYYWRSSSKGLEKHVNTYALTVAPKWSSFQNPFKQHKTCFLCL